MRSVLDVIGLSLACKSHDYFKNILFFSLVLLLACWPHYFSPYYIICICHLGKLVVLRDSQLVLFGAFLLLGYVMQGEPYVVIFIDLLSCKTNTFISQCTYSDNTANHMHLLNYSLCLTGDNFTHERESFVL